MNKKSKKSPRSIKLGSSVEPLTLNAERVKYAIIGRGICLNSDTLEKAISAVSNYMSLHDLKLCKALLDLIKYGKVCKNGKIPGLFNPKYAYVYTLCVGEDSLKSGITDSNEKTTSLRKGSRLFENECSFILGAADIFLPGVFPWAEIRIYIALGKALCSKCVLN